MKLEELLKDIPKEVMDLRNTRGLHKLASKRAGLDDHDFGLEIAVTELAKKAYYTRRVNSLIQAGIAATGEV